MAARNEKWLVIDVSFLCYRAFHTTGHLSEDDKPTGVLFGVVRDIQTLYSRFNPSRFVFCFDYGIRARLALCPQYKQKRRQRRAEYTPEEKSARLEMAAQIDILRTRLLRQCGFRNIQFQLDREADDMIAAVCEVLPPGVSAVVVSSDHDLYQILNDRVSLYNPTTKQLYTAWDFRNEWGISPSQWADVKAMAGCASDDVPGIVGVGEKTAAKFLRSKLEPDSKTYAKIIKGNSIWNANLKIVTLPFPDTRLRRLKCDRVTRMRWVRTMREYGLLSLRANVPGV